jgi:hypothetical protein
VGSCSAGGGDSDDAAADALEALIQTELSKFQQQQAARYAELLACGQAAVLPLASPAPQQQLLRAHQHQQSQQQHETPLPLSDGESVVCVLSAGWQAAAHRGRGAHACTDTVVVTLLGVVDASPQMHETTMCVLSTCHLQRPPKWWQQPPALLAQLGAAAACWG